MVYVPAFTVDERVMVSTEVAEPPDASVTVVWLNVTVIPVGAVADKVKEPLKPPRELTVMVEIPVRPGLMLREDGDAEIEKSGFVCEGTVIATVVEWLMEPLAAVTAIE